MKYNKSEIMKMAWYIGVDRTTGKLIFEDAGDKRFTFTPEEAETQLKTKEWRNAL